MRRRDEKGPRGKRNDDRREGTQMKEREEKWPPK